MLVRFVRLCIPVVLILGLSSCAKKKDEFSARPFAHWTEQDSRHELNLQELPDGPVAANAVIDFGADDLTLITATVDCGTDPDRITNSVEIKNRSSILVTQLLPPSFFSRFNVDQTPKLTCSANFNITNANGSSHRFTLPQLSIDHFNSLQNADVRHPNFDKDATLFESSQPGIFELQGGKKLAFPSRIELNCETYRFSEIVKRAEPLASILKRLAEKPFSGAAGDIDPRLPLNQQQCHVIIEEPVPGASVGRFTFTPNFPLRFAKLRTRIETSFEPAKDDSFEMTGVLHIRIHNESDLKQVFTLNAMAGFNVRFQRIKYKVGIGFYMAAVYNAHADYQIVGGKILKSNSDSSTFEIPAKSEVLINGAFHPDHSCLSLSNTNQPVTPYQERYSRTIGVHVADFIAFSNEQLLQRHFNVGGNVIEHSGPVEDLPILERTKVVGAFPYFIPTAYFPLRFQESIRVLSFDHPEPACLIFDRLD